MKPPKWAEAVLRLFAPPDQVDQVLGDLEEIYRRRVRSRGRLVARALTGLEALDMAAALTVERIRGGATASELSRPRSPMTSLRDARPSWLDFKLGFRMLFRYPGLTVVSVVAMAFAIALGATNLQYNADFIYPTLPLDEGDRIVEIRNRDLVTSFVAPGSVDDFARWRDQLRSVEETGAFRTLHRNLITGRGPASPVVGAEISTQAMALARVSPVLGRALTEADEVPGAPEVVVIGFDVWHSHFGGDPGVVGQVVTLGSDPATVIGVMPEGFGWPWAHQAWTPLRLGALEVGADGGPAVQVVARLVGGTTLRQARAEIVAFGMRISAESPETHERLRPELVRYGRPPIPLSDLGFAGAYVMTLQVFVGLMVLICANVTLLLFARTSARDSEIALRTALGASRSRIVTQLFAEALVLGGVAAVAGLWATQLALDWTMDVLPPLMANATRADETMFPFWFGQSLSSSTIMWTLVLTVLAAAVAGIVPALKITGPGLQPRLQRAGAGRYGLEFGNKWTAVIVGQIAVTVGFLPIGIAAGFGKGQIEQAPYGFPAEEYLTVQLAADGVFSSLADALRRAPAESSGPRYVASVREFRRRLAGEPGIRAVATMGQLPGAEHPRRWVDVEGATATPNSARGHRAQIATVDLDFFETVSAPIVSGRSFDAADLESEQRVVVVNEEFVRLILGGQNPVGRWLTFPRSRPSTLDSADEQPRRYLIVGVVKQLAMTTPTIQTPLEGSGVYHLLGPEDAYPLHVAVHVGPDPAGFAPRLREIAAEVDETLQLPAHVRPLDQSAREVALMADISFRVLAAAGAIAMLLSAAGIFSIMSFTVSRRTREIGVRVALGADRRRIVSSVFYRALRQVGMGVAAGAVLLAFFVFLFRTNYEYEPTLDHILFLLAYLAVMPPICMLACVVPMRRAVAVEPSEALRADG